MERAIVKGGAAVIELPADADGVPVIRTDFSDDAAWQTIQGAVAAEDVESGCEPNLSFVERRDLASLDVDALVKQIPTRYPSGYEQPFLIIVDTTAMTSPEHPVLLVDLSEEDSSPAFRALPREVAAIEANLSIANVDFNEFADSADTDGVFRGFHGHDPDQAASADHRPATKKTTTLDVDDDAAAAQRRDACAAAGLAIHATLEDPVPPLSGGTGTVRLRVTLPRPASRLYQLIANLDITSTSAPNDCAVGNEFLMGTYLPDIDGFVGPDGQILCQWTELAEPTRVRMTWAWVRTLANTDIEDRLPQRATLTVDLTPQLDESTILDLVHDGIPIEWVIPMTTVWTSKIDQWAYQSRPKRRSAR